MESTDEVSRKRVELEGCSPGHDGRDVALSGLAGTLYNRFCLERKIGDVDEAITYDDQGVATDLEAVTFAHAALELCPQGHPNRGASLDTLASALWRRFNQRAAIYDLDEALKLHRAASELHPSGHPDRSSSLHGLALCFSSRYDNQGVVADLEEAVKFGRAALEFCPPGHPSRDVSLYNLASDLRKRFKQLAAVCDLDEALELHRAALDLRPPGHPHRSSSLHGLALCFSSRYGKQGVVADLEEAVMFSHAAAELCPLGHPIRATYLYTLSCALWKAFQLQASIPGSGGARFVRRAALVLRPRSDALAASSFRALSLHLWDKFRKQPAIADLDNAICLATYALELRLPKYRFHAVSVEHLAVLVRERTLCAIGHFFRDRFRTQHALADLNEAIRFHRYVLQLRLAGHASHLSSLHHLALCLLERFHDTAAVGDLDEAISLERKVVELSDPDDPSYNISNDCLATCLQLKISPQVSRVSSIGSVATEYEVSQVIRHVILEILETAPTRLLHTHSGILCGRDMLISHFVSGPQYKQLLSSASSYDPVERASHVHTAISRHFQFVMFSHRWGEVEPCLHDIQGRAIYDLPPCGGIKKLQKFCPTAFKHHKNSLNQI
ncbi:hypothetical protein F5141DRAFT_1274483 [Pisolithus sp. B1]|nr:hypothetical protein F5141DRAFT_1274483 [Pisolithus sp. B1]